jgi:hypothetical protein
VAVRDLVPGSGGGGCGGVVRTPQAPSEASLSSLPPSSRGLTHSRESGPCHRAIGHSIQASTSICSRIRQAVSAPGRTRTSTRVSVTACRALTSLRRSATCLFNILRGDGAQRGSIETTTIVGSLPRWESRLRIPSSAQRKRAPTCGFRLGPRRGHLEFAPLFAILRRVPGPWGLCSRLLPSRLPRDGSGHAFDYRGPARDTQGGRSTLEPRASRRGSGEERDPRLGSSTVAGKGLAAPARLSTFDLKNDD